MTTSWQASYTYLLTERTRVTRTIEVGDSVMIDLDADGRPIGVEVLDGSDWMAALASLAMCGRVKIT